MIVDVPTIVVLWVFLDLLYINTRINIRSISDHFVLNKISLPPYFVRMKGLHSFHTQVDSSENLYSSKECLIIEHKLEGINNLN